MTGYVDKALFVYGPEAQSLGMRLEAFSSDVSVESIAIREFLGLPEEQVSQSVHVVICARTPDLKRAMERVIASGAGVGILTLPGQKMLAAGLNLPKTQDEQIALSLRADTKEIPVLRCNGEVVLTQSTIGRIPVLDGKDGRSIWQSLMHSLKRFLGIRLMGFTVTMADGRRIETAACGAIVPHPSGRSLTSRFVTLHGGGSDALIPVVVAAPTSIVEYFSFLSSLLIDRKRSRQLPPATGVIHSASLQVDTEMSLRVSVDGEKSTVTPARFHLDTAKLKINSGLSPADKPIHMAGAGDPVRIENLPRGNEIVKAKRNRIPVFPYASEERFRDLFSELRKDASINPVFAVLMVLSTLLATTGLFLDNSTVVIGAMLLAPLMAPIVSMAMGMLRLDSQLYWSSAWKIVLGILLALVSSMVFTRFMPALIVTGEMQNRLNPNLLDLVVAILAGIAAAYTKSHREIMQGLAGVAIAVALVPPLAVAGIGLGRGDMAFFLGAFLLFTTNLIGIVLFALLTFRVLGFSAAIRGRQSLAMVLVVLATITVPLYYSYKDISADLTFARHWQQERFLINDKYIIVRRVERHRERGRDVVTMDIMTREALTAEEFREFKDKIRRNFPERFFVRANLIYIL